MELLRIGEDRVKNKKASKRTTQRKKLEAGFLKLFTAEKLLKKNEKI